MANVLGVHEEMNLPVYRNGQLRCDDVISGFHVMFRIETKQILGGFADHLGMNWTKLSILTWITKIKCKLPGLSLNWHGVRRGWREIHPGPSLGSERAQSQNFNAYQNNRGNDQTFGPAGENFKFSLRAGLVGRRLPDKQGKKDLRGQKGYACLDHRVSHLIINHLAMSRDICRCFPGMHDYGNRRNYGDHYDGHCTPPSHPFPPLPAAYAGDSIRISIRKMVIHSGAALTFRKLKNRRS